jgi:glycerol-3-phosphate acyltransferase PlsY
MDPRLRGDDDIKRSRMSYLVIFLAYFLGSIPFGMLVARWMDLGDLRKIGSGNIGATNVLRTGNKGAAVATLLLDMAKGGLAVLVAKWLQPDVIFAAAFAAVAGHVFPVWLKFKGGKGVATYFGAVFGLSPLLFLLSGAVWLVIFAVFRYSSLASIAATGFAVLASFSLLGSEGVVWLAAIGGLVVVRHKDNIIRLMQGKEHKFGSK